MRDFLLVFIPLFVAVDAIGILPFYISFTEGLSREKKTRVITQSMVTAFVIGIGFLFLGKWILRLLSVLVADFRIAGGLVLLVISLADILRRGEMHKIPADTVGAVPIGTPLVTGPAVLTTMIILMDVYGLKVTIISFIVNLIIAWLVFAYSGAITRLLGKAGSKAVSKIASLLLAAIAVKMIRLGVIETISSALQK